MFDQLYKKWFQPLSSKEVRRSFGAYARVAVIGGVGIACIAGLAYFGKAIVINGIIMGILTIIGLAILWLKLPQLLKKWLAKGDLIVDIVFTVCVFVAFGLTVTGLIGAAVTCIFLSILLKINRTVQQNKSKPKLPDQEDESE